jgi:hypothetical protein
MVFGALHFAGGLTQTDWFNMTTSAVATAASGLSYNQACYTSNVSMRQAQKYQEKNYRLAWTGVARDDIRTMMGLTVERLTNYTVAAAMILCFAAMGLFASSFSDDCPEIVKYAFWVSEGLSIMHLTLSIMFAVKGQNKAFENTMRLLTWECRPENPANYDHDYMSQAQQFEKDGVRSIFRLPGVAPSYAEQPKPDAKKSEGADTGVEGGHGKKGGVHKSKTRKAEKEVPGSGLEVVRPRTSKLWHLARFARFMQLWQPHDTQSKGCLGIGLLSLVQGAMYWTLGKFSGHDHSLFQMDAAALILPTLMLIFLYIVIMVYETNVKFKRGFTRWSVMLLFCCAPLSGTFAVLIPDAVARRVFSSICAFSHFLLYACLLLRSYWEIKMPSEITEKFITGPEGQKFTKHIDDDVEQGKPASTFAESDEALFDITMHNPDEEKEATRVRNSVRRTLRVSLFLSCGVWFITFLSTFSFYINPSTEMYGVRSVPITWMFKAVWPHALAIAGDEAFIADKYKVYVVSLADGTPHVPRELSCNFTGIIADVAAACDTQHGVQVCHPLVLLESDSPRVVDCTTGEETVILQQNVDVQLKHFALHGGSMMALRGKAVVEYKSQPDGWRPLWEKAQVRSKLAQGLDYDSHRLYIFERSDSASTVDIADIQYGLPVGRWTLPAQFSPIVAGAAMGDGSLLMLPRRPAPELLKWVPPL